MAAGITDQVMPAAFAYVAAELGQSSSCQSIGIDQLIWPDGLSSVVRRLSSVLIP
jgi:hypothetical protein